MIITARYSSLIYEKKKNTWRYNNYVILKEQVKNLLFVVPLIVIVVLTVLSDVNEVLQNQKLFEISLLMVEKWLAS